LEEGNYHFLTQGTRKRSFYNRLQKMLNKNNKNDYILFSGGLSGRMGKAEFHYIAGVLGNQLQIPTD